MAVVPADEFEVHEDDLSPLAAVLNELGLQGGGRSWVNLVPEVREGHDPGPRSIISSVFSAKGEAVPLATWSAPVEPGGRASLGIEHGSGPKALVRLEEATITLPAGWTKLADHPRRGLVVSVAADAPPEDVLWWLLAAAHVLSVVPLTDSWLAKVYRPAAGEGSAG